MGRVFDMPNIGYEMKCVIKLRPRESIIMTFGQF